jgi:GTP cyclohydrolase I
MSMRSIACEVFDSIADMHRSQDTRQIPVNKVGIKDILHPVRIMGRGGEEQHTVARFNMYVNLLHNFKGTHMSRFVEILMGHEREITVASLKTMLAEMVERLEASEGHINMTFPFFVNKSAPVSGIKSLLNYDVSLHGELLDGLARLWVKVVVPVTSLCPCSKSIARYGAHNQRAHVTLAVRTEDMIWIEELIELVEGEASCELYGLLKRADEKYVTERAYDNPKFVEDTVRDIAVKLNADARILAYSVESENFESIHNHSAYAMVESEPDRENDS